MVSLLTLSPHRPRRRWLAPLFGAALVAGLDQAVKRIVLEVRPDIAVIPGLFSVTFGTNTGVAFGLFRGFPLGVTSLGLAMLVGILAYLVRVAPVAGRLERTGLALLLGGAAGNLIDRFRLGYVVDYLDVYVGEYHWPTFNLADSAITVSVALLALGLRRPSSRTAEAPPAGGVGGPWASQP